MNNKLYEIKERILQLTDILNVTNQFFFKKIEMTYGNFTGENKKRSLNSNAIANILVCFPEVNSEWLLTGSGPMLKEDKTPYNDQKKETPRKNEAEKSCEKLLNENSQLIKDKISLMQENSNLKDDKILLIKENSLLKEQLWGLTTKTNDLEIHNKVLFEEINRVNNDNALLKKAIRVQSSDTQQHKTQLKKK